MTLMQMEVENPKIQTKFSENTQASIQYSWRFRIQLPEKVESFINDRNNKMINMFPKYVMLKECFRLTCMNNETLYKQIDSLIKCNSYLRSVNNQQLNEVEKLY